VVCVHRQVLGEKGFGLEIGQGTQWVAPIRITHALGGGATAAVALVPAVAAQAGLGHELLLEVVATGDQRALVGLLDRVGIGEAGEVLAGVAAGADGLVGGEVETLVVKAAGADDVWHQDGLLGIGQDSILFQDLDHLGEPLGGGSYGEVVGANGLAGAHQLDVVADAAILAELDVAGNQLDVLLADQVLEAQKRVLVTGLDEEIDGGDEALGGLDRTADHRRLKLQLIGISGVRNVELAGDEDLALKEPGSHLRCDCHHVGEDPGLDASSQQDLDVLLEMRPQQRLTTRDVHALQLAPAVGLAEVEDSDSFLQAQLPRAKLAALDHVAAGTAQLAAGSNFDDPILETTLFLLVVAV